MKLRLQHLLVALLACSALVVAACGDDEESNAGAGATSAETTANEMAASEDAGTESGAAELRAGLTALLQEHVYEASGAVVAGLSSGLDSKEFEAAAATLDANSKALSDAIGSAYGDAAGEQFLELWRKHIGMFVDYTKGAATKDDAAKKKAIADLDQYREDFGAFLASANPNLTKEAVAEALVPHVDSLAKAIDLAAAGDAKVFDAVKEAASHMPDTANVLAGAIAQQFPDKFSGSADSGASQLRAGLTALLQEHVYLAGIGIAQGIGNGLDSPQFEAAAETLDANSVELSEAIGGAYGDAAGEQFLELWRKHIGMFVDYAKGAATDDQAVKDKAVADLDQYREDFGAFLASANPNLTKEAVAEELEVHVSSLAKYVDAVAAKDTALYDNLAEAASHMPATANVLAGAIAQQFPEKFPAS